MNILQRTRVINEKQEKGCQTLNLLSPNTLISGSIQVSESAPRKPTTTLLGSQTVQLRRVVLPASTRGFGKITKVCYRINLLYKIYLYILLNFWKVIGVLVEFGGFWQFWSRESLRRGGCKRVVQPKPKMVLDICMGIWVC